MFQFREYKNKALQPAMLWPHADWHKLKTVVVAETATTPVASAYILAHCNNRNRHLTDSRAKYLSKLMGMGKWFMTGEPLIFDSEGEGLSIQHRLKACEYAGVEFPSLVVLDVDPECSDWVDNVRAKTVGDRLAAVGTPHANALASMLRVMYCWRHAGYLGRLNRFQFDMEQADETLDACPGLDASAAWCSQNAETARFFRGPGGAGSMHWIMERVGTGLGHEFLTMAASNRIPTEERWNVVAKLNKQIGSWRKGALVDDVCALTLKAWNLFRTGRQVQSLVMRETDAYPKVDGWEYDRQHRPIACGTFAFPPLKADPKPDEA